MELIFGDTETNGMIAWKEPSESLNQPHIVQLAALIVDEKTRKIKQSINVIVKPQNWRITQETIDINGITHEYAMDVGLPEKMVIEMFLAMCDGRKRVFYNTTFDNRIIRIGTKRYFDEQIQSAWKESSEYECAMQLCKKVIGPGGKYPSLKEAYQYFFNREANNAHTAMGDSQACMEVYFAAKDHLEWK